MSGPDRLDDVPDRSSLTVQVSPTLITRIEAEARTRMVGRSLFVEKLLELALDNLAPPELRLKQPPARPVAGITYNDKVGQQ
jgi:hypothetical protein